MIYTHSLKSETLFTPIPSSTTPSGPPVVYALVQQQRVVTHKTLEFPLYACVCVFMFMRVWQNDVILAVLVAVVVVASTGTAVVVVLTLSTLFSF